MKLASALFAFGAAAGALAAAVDTAFSSSATFKYAVVPGIFIQDDPATVPADAGSVSCLRVASLALCLSSILSWSAAASKLWPRGPVLFALGKA